MNTRIEVCDNRLLVICPRERDLYRSVLGALLALFILAQAALALRTMWHGAHAVLLYRAVLPAWLLRLLEISLAMLGIVLAAWVVIQLLRPMFGKRQTLRCTPDSLELEWSDFGRAWKTRRFSREDIEAISFGVVSVSEYGSESGLLLQVGKLQVKALPGLKAAEAQRVLDLLRQLHFKVTEDPAMKMLIEIEERRFWWLDG